jgi:hypothetical protein
LEHGQLAVAQARPGVLNEDLVVRDDLSWRSILHPKPSIMAHFHDCSVFSAPVGRLATWDRSRDRLRRSLTVKMEQRTLPVPPTSPLAHERAWFLARLIMAKGRPSTVGQCIDVGALRTDLEPLMDQVRTTRQSRWQWSGGPTLDSDDIRWLHTHLQQIAVDTLSNPRPPADRAHAQARFFWQAYSPELTCSITADVMRDALVGYSDLVKQNFPRFGAALGLHSIFPVRVEGFVNMPGDGSQSLPGAVTYALRPDQAPDRREPPVVDLRIADAAQATVDALWANLHNRGSSQFGLPAVVQQEDVFLPFHDRQATNLAYRWLANDLQAVGWLKKGVNFSD